ncbi:MAG: nitroreductase [candidate division Zixibacteria bacterium CG_4_9_14_3_um_filter_46_8]|nr:MAG: nitroreductase [candidate division Zixibacteria bacterium CG_4_9_14_3_um_filter_46_8]
MEVFEAVKFRRSIRKYLDKEVVAEKLIRILESGRLAPSSKNRQEWRFVVVTDNKLKRQLRDAAGGQSFVEGAPIVIAACATGTDYIMSCGQAAYVIDVSIALTQMNLQAVEEGLGCCWIGSFDEDRVKDILGIPTDIRVVELMTLGYPKEQPAARSRLSMEEITFVNHWGDAPDQKSDQANSGHH